LQKHQNGWVFGTVSGDILWHKLIQDTIYRYSHLGIKPGIQVNYAVQAASTRESCRVNQEIHWPISTLLQ